MSFDAVGIVARDPARTVAFFRLLGVEIAQYQDSGHYEGQTPSGVRIMLDSIEVIRSFDPAFVKRDGNGVTLCFKLDSPREVDELHDRIVAAGFASVKPPWDAFWGHRYACVADPDGNQVDLFAAL